jgi:hypothetical protein
MPAPTAVNSWYVLRLSPPGGSPEGPFTLEELAGLLRSGRLAWTDLARGGRDWARLFELRELQSQLPRAPSPSQLALLTPEGNPARSKARGTTRISARLQDARTLPALARQAEALPAAGNITRLLRPQRGGHAHWRAQLAGREYGPVTEDQIREAVRFLPDLDAFYVWRDGMPNWLPVSDVEELAHRPGFTGLVARTKRIRGLDGGLKLELGRNVRAHARASVAATVARVRTSGRAEPLGICADLSESGFQLLLQNDFSPRVGDSYVFEIYPLRASGLASFRARARAMWFHPMERAAGFLFQELQAGARRALETFVRARHRAG